MILAEIEAYYDRAPRAGCRVEAIGPLLLFVPRGGWPYYARPAPGCGPIAVGDVLQVLERQRALALPLAIEWVLEVTPSLWDAARDAGMSVQAAPILASDGTASAAAPEGTVVRMLERTDTALAEVLAVVDHAFGGTGPAYLEYHRAQMKAGLIRTCAALAAGVAEPTALGGGSHVPREDVSEIVGVAVAPEVRRRGLGSAITATLAADARASGARLVFCSAGTPEADRVYRRLGFRQVGTAMVASAH